MKILTFATTMVKNWAIKETKMYYNVTLHIIDGVGQNKRKFGMRIYKLH